MSTRPMSMGTRREAILTAAERIFAEEGYHGTTMRRIAEVAGSTLALVAYHFTTKLALYREIFLRRQHINETRRTILATLDFGAPDALERVVGAFVDPVLELHHSEKDVWFARLVLREAADPSSQERAVLKEFFDPMAREFIAALKQVLPDKPEGFHHWAYLFSVGALTQSAFDVRVGNLTDAPLLEQKHQLLRGYIIAALRHG
ncbi:AcrR family transcriptional regulator [Crossiella equi]|uniref:AcrR family transcriptional regulator n=1 Tax=Crossiella equi TaxID=130796 RepID=A0ABS5A8T0_9PSEU|nr:TetR/AcrR family transcriptional regulator [Crossiella equi]MBP2472120.1 AcrR family transcriptional regulator [Crossiella equi]